MFTVVELRNDMHKMRAALVEDTEYQKDEMHHLVNKWLNRMERMIKVFEPMNGIEPLRINEAGLRVSKGGQTDTELGQAIADVMGRWAQLMLEIRIEERHRNETAADR